VAGALRFELLSQGQPVPRGKKRYGGHDGPKAPVKQTKARPGRSPREKVRKPGNNKSGKPGKGKSWKR
jgi:ribonuclease R